MPARAVAWVPAPDRPPGPAAGFLTGGLRALRPELEDGALLQVNVCSLLGRHGPEAQRGAERLVRDGLAYVVGSDGHGGSPGHTLAAGAQAARVAGASPPRSRQLTEANPRFMREHGIPGQPDP